MNQDFDLSTIEAQAQAIAPKVNMLNDAGKREYIQYNLGDKYSQEALDVAYNQLASGEQMSSVLDNIGITIFGQEGMKKMPNFALTDLIPVRTDLPNGTLSKFYKIYGTPDNLSGVSDVTIDDFNASVTKATNENFFPNTNVHIKYKQYNTSTNDFALKVALFVEMANNEYLQFIRPMERYWNTISYRIIADRSQASDPTNFVVANLTKPVAMVYDIEKEFDTEEDRIAWINTTLKQLKEANPENALFAKDWLPKGSNPFTKDDNWEIGSENVQVLATQEWYNILQTKIKSTLLHPELLDVIGGSVRTFIPSSTFSTYGNVTGIDKDTFIFMSKGAIDFLMLYNDTKTQTTPKLFDIKHRYMRFGVAFDKQEILFNAHLTIKDTTPKSTK